jgi:membrane protein implicated in regulation of membrane protease activity
MEATFILETWHWFVLSFVILGIECIGFNGFLLGSSTAAAISGVLLTIFPEFAKPQQLIVFSLNSMLFTYLYWKYWYCRKYKEDKSNSDLNNRAAQLVGTIMAAPVDIPIGVSRIQIGDTMWKISTTANIAKQQSIKIYGYDGLTLLIEPSDIEIITKC